MKTLFLSVALFATSNTVFAEPHCTDAQKDTWMKEADFKTKVEQEGYKIKKFKVTKGNCYEIYGKDSAGKNIEIYYNPVDGVVVKSK